MKTGVLFSCNEASFKKHEVYRILYKYLMGFIYVILQEFITLSYYWDWNTSCKTDKVTVRFQYKKETINKYHVKFLNTLHVRKWTVALADLLSH